MTRFSPVSFSTSESAIDRQKFAVAHGAFMVVASSWLLGGIGPTAEWIMAGISAPAYVVLFLEARARRAAGDRAGFRRLLRWAAPLLALGILAVVSALNPSHRQAFLYDGLVLRPVPHLAWLPSSANPAGSLRIFACLAGLAASGLAIAFCVHSRRALRGLVLGLAINALVIAVVGTLQRQTGASGPYFGAVPRANPAWFGTFLYHNHWGAFAVLHTAATLGLVFHSLRHPPARGWPYGPGPMLALVALIIAITAPLSSSRSSTALMLLLGLAATAGALLEAFRSGRRRRSSRAGLLRAGIALGALGLAAGAAFWQSREIIAARAATTVRQIAELRAGASGYSRADLYADTWRMAADRPVFGWGLESYGRIFLDYCRFKPGSDGLMNTFEDAHSDWLQSLAETGLVGTALLLAFGLLPLVESFRPRHLTSLAGWLLAGCALVAAYAWVEFPFANPAVVASWWLFWFAALRTLQLTPSSTSSAPPAPGS